MKPIIIAVSAKHYKIGHIFIIIAYQNHVLEIYSTMSKYKSKKFERALQITRILPNKRHLFLLFKWPTVFFTVRSYGLVFKISFSGSEFLNRQCKFSRISRNCVWIQAEYCRNKIFHLKICHFRRLN